MSLFEFLMVLVSIIIGFGLAELMTGVAGMIRNRDSVQPYWVHILIIAAIFVAHLQQWWEAWGLRSTPEWTFLGLLMLLGGPVGLFLIAHLLFPDPMRGTNFRDYYYGAMRPLWLVAILTVSVATLFRPLAFGDDLIRADNATSFVFVGVFVMLGLSGRRSLHQVLAPVVFFLVVLDVIQWNFVIGA